jgi:Mrp family chromosome partitioning ATPase
MDPKSMNDATTDAASIFAPLWKRKWLILAVAILVGAGTYLYYKRQPSVYTAKTQLYLGGNAEQATAPGAAPPKTLSGRALSDQVEIINSSVVSGEVHKRLREAHQLPAARAKSKAAASGSSDFITISTEARTPRGAVTLANAIAQAYVKRQHANYLRGVQTAITNTREQLRRIETAPKTKGSKSTNSASTELQTANLASKISQLESSLSGFTGVQQVSTAKASPLPVSPTPKKNAIFGFVLGLILACVAAYALTRLDRRIRTLAEVEDVYHTQVLAALPKVGSPVLRPGGQRGPAKPLIEPLRRLQTALALGDMVEGKTNGCRVVLCISADAGDGRSTLIANLARIQADGGERVAVIEADFRRPSLSGLLDVSAPNGLAEVLTGKVACATAMQTVKTVSQAAVSEEREVADGAVSTAVQAESAGSISVLLSGGQAVNPPALLGSEAMARLLHSVTEDHDYVLIDVPPPLEVSDAVPLLRLVDGIVLVARLGHTRDISAQRLDELLRRTATAPVLGAVANCVPRKDLQRYGFSWAPTEQRRRKLSRR